MLDCDGKKIIAIRAEVSFNLSQKDVNHKDIGFIRPNTYIWFIQKQNPSNEMIIFQFSLKTLNFIQKPSQHLHCSSNSSPKLLHFCFSFFFVSHFR